MAVVRAIVVMALAVGCTVTPSGSAAPPSATTSATTSAPTAHPPTAPPVASATPAPATPSPTIPPLPTASLPADLAAELQAVLDQRIEQRPDEASVSAAVIVPGEGTWAGAAGYASTDGELATPDTAYAVGSITKTFTAALIMLLVRDGVLSLEDPAAEWLDEEAAAKSNGATVRQMLAHRSGIAEHVQNLDVAAKRRWTPAEILDLVAEPNFVPDARFEYSNTNYILLGMVAERAGGAPMEEQLRDRIFGPHGLGRTFLGGRETVEPPIAHGYGRHPELSGDIYDGSGYLPDETLATAAWAAGAISSTAPDVARWLYLLRSGEVVGPELTAQMFDFADDGYGLGVTTGGFPGGATSVGHVGAIPGYVALVFYFADTGNVVAAITNTDVEDLFQVVVQLDDVAATH